MGDNMLKRTFSSKKVKNFVRKAFISSFIPLTIISCSPKKQAQSPPNNVVTKMSAKKAQPDKYIKVNDAYLRESFVKKAVEKAAEFYSKKPQKRIFTLFNKEVLVYHFVRPLHYLHVELMMNANPPLHPDQEFDAFVRVLPFVYTAYTAYKYNLLPLIEQKNPATLNNLKVVRQWAEKTGMWSVIERYYVPPKKVW